jgi:hypothetical protein
MQSAVLYALLVAMTIGQCTVACMAERADTNIGNVTRGRHPDAGCSMLLSLLVLLATYTLAATLLNHWRPLAGFGVVALVIVLDSCNSYLKYRKLQVALSELVVHKAEGIPSGSRHDGS